jgi:hypothetical protein
VTGTEPDAEDTGGELRFIENERLLYSGDAWEVRAYAYEATEVAFPGEGGPPTRATVRWIDVWVGGESLRVSPGEYSQWRGDVLAVLDAAHAATSTLNGLLGGS